MGQLDLTDDSLVLDYTGASPLAAIANQLKQGFSGGAWTGNGIRSSAAAAQLNRAIGFAEAADLGSPATFLGEPVDSTTLLLRYTLPGDANLDGSVTLNDFTRLAAGFGTTSRWSSGDFNYDGLTTLADFTALAANFGQVLPAGLPRGAAVPEPAAAMLGLAFVAAFLPRRRNRQR